MKENEKEQIDPSAAALGFAEEIHAMADDISLILGWSVVIGADLVGIFILAILVLYFHLQFLQLIFQCYVILSTFFIGFWVIYTITQGHKTRKTLRNWDENFIRFYYVLKFETFPPEGATPQSRIFNQLLSVFVKLKDSFMDYQEKRPEAMKDFVNPTIRGKRGSHSFDVYIGRHVLETDSELDNFVEYQGEVYVKRFENKKPVDDKNLSTFGDEIKDCIATRFYKKSAPIFRIIAVSPSSFSESAKQYVRNPKNRIGGKSFDLVEEKTKGYYVEWIS